MSLLLQPWFWTAWTSAIVLVGLFFFAYHWHMKKERLYRQQNLMSTSSGIKVPSDPSDIANLVLHGKRTFRLGNLFYVMAAAYFHKD